MNELALTRQAFIESNLPWTTYYMTASSDLKMIAFLCNEQALSNTICSEVDRKLKKRRSRNVADVAAKRGMLTQREGRRTDKPKRGFKPMLNMSKYGGCVFGIAIAPRKPSRIAILWILNAPCAAYLIAGRALVRKVARASEARLVLH